MKKSSASAIPLGHALVGIVVGSPNDLPTVVKVRDALSELGIPSEIVVASAHRTPDKVLSYLDRVHKEGVQVLIGAAGVAARILALKYPAIDQALEQAGRKERARYEQTADEVLAKLAVEQVE